MLELTHSTIPLFPPSPHSWNCFNRYHFSIYIPVYTVFIPYSPSHTLSPPPPHFHWYQPPLPPQARPVLWFYLVIFLLELRTETNHYFFSVCKFSNVCKYYVFNMLSILNLEFLNVLSGFFYNLWQTIAYDKEINI
jgi:hypothetical protein